ncbi:MAG: hypothetical protein ACR2NZ_18460 [Rubripirellula sp.]
MRKIFRGMIWIVGLAGFIAAMAGALRVFNVGREFAGQFSLAIGLVLIFGAFIADRLIDPHR